MTLKFLLASFSGIVILNSIFFGIILLFNSKGLLKNKLLGLLLFGIALRTGKSIIILLFPHVPDAIPAIGLVGMGAMGPLLFFYVQNLNDEKAKLGSRLYPHLIFSALMGVSLHFANDQVIFWLYFFTALQLALYIVVAVRLHLGNNYDSEVKKWVTILIVSVSMMWAVYTVQLFLQDWVTYLTGTVIASGVLFGLLFYALKSNRIFGRIKNRKFSASAAQLSSRITILMEQDKVYRQSDLTLAKLATMLGVKPYLISNTLNEYHGKSFPEFVNQYRIQEARELLHSEKHRIYSIEAIAFDCGFSTPSAFYTYFKKVTKLTPSEYREISK